MSVPLRISASWRAVISISIGLTAFSLCLAIHWEDPVGARDFEWSLSAARDLLAGRDPYDPHKVDFFIYPLPAALAALPFVLLNLNGALAGALFFGLSSLALAWGALAQGTPWRLLVFLSYPYLWALVTVQWPPLLLAVTFMPWLYPLVIAKPQLGLPITLSHFSRRGVIAAGAFGLISLIVMPDWPLRWIARLGVYGAFGSFVPALILPLGPVMLLAWRFWQRPPARLLAVFALMPQRAYYDQLVLWGVPQTRRQMLALTVTSWLTLPAGALLAFLPITANDLVLCGVYLPALLLVWRQGRPSAPSVPTAHV